MQETVRIVVSRAEGRPWATWALVPALALPVLFLHVRYQPKVEIDLGSSSAALALSDAAVLAVVLAAVVAGIRGGWGPLRPSRGLWVLTALFLGLVGAATFYPLLWQDDYHLLTHLVTAAKFGEYALLAPALPLLLRRRDDALPLLWAAASWSAIASAWGLLQFAGLVDEFEGRRPLQREVSFLGVHDFAALSAAALALGFATLLLARAAGGGARALGWVAAIAGAVGLVLSASVAGVLGASLAAAATLGVARVRRELTARRLLAVAGALAIVAAGALSMRSGELTRTIRSIGGSEPTAARSVESYVQRSLLGYIGLRIFVDHPVVGVGWQGSHELENYGPYLADAHRRFPDVTELAFPAPEHSWGVQNAYLQTLTDLGLVGAAAVLGLFLTALWLGLKAALRSPPETVSTLVGPLWLLAAAGVWNGLGLVAGIPLDALTWLGLGLVAAALAWPLAHAH